MKLNLGAGENEIAGYVNLDIKKGQPVYPLNYPDESINEIRASHILEHFSHRDVLAVLKDWVAKLKPGGTLKIAVPDFGKVTEAYKAGEKLNVVGYLMGGQVDQNDYHKSLFDKSTLMELMMAAGLTDLREWQSEINDCASLPISLNLQGTKPADGQQENYKKIWAVMSAPRLGFMDNMFSAMRAFLPLGIKLERGCGAFWGHILQNMMEKHLDDGTDWLFTLDYDTWFTRNHVIKLCQLMAENPQADAIAPVQIYREQDYPLVGVFGEASDGLVNVDVREFQKPLTEVATAHFGLTLFRVEALRKMEFPWFWEQPGPDGRWQKGRQDPDIYFWNKFRAAGNKIFQANEVYVGHLQLVCTFPGKPEENWKPRHVYVKDLDAGKIPPWCEPEVTFTK